MRIHPLAIISLCLALVALVVAWYATGVMAYLVIGVAVAIVLLIIATLFQYTKIHPEVKQVPIENFSLWADVGEPVAELRRLNIKDVETAVRVAATDLGSLSSNAEMLAARVSMISDREGFEELRKENMHKDIEILAQGIQGVVEKLRSAKGFPPEVIASLEQYASQSDRMANKLFEFKSGKSEVVHIYVDPLRRAAEKLSRDLRLSSVNLSNFAQGTEKKETRS